MYRVGMGMGQVFVSIRHIRNQATLHLYEPFGSYLRRHLQSWGRQAAQTTRLDALMCLDMLRVLSFGVGRNWWREASISHVPRIAASDKNSCVAGLDRPHLQSWGRQAAQTTRLDALMCLDMLRVLSFGVGLECRRAARPGCAGPEMSSRSETQSHQRRGAAASESRCGTQPKRSASPQRCVYLPLPS